MISLILKTLIIIFKN